MIDNSNGALHASYPANLEKANEFEDFVADALYEAGMLIHVYRSRRRQVAGGESRAGLEVKLDRRFRDTGNLFIETEERHSVNAPFVAAGINGNCWLYAIGDCCKFWMLAVTLLRLMSEQPAIYRPAATATARGFLLPLEKADKWAARVFEFSPVADNPDRRMLRELLQRLVLRPGFSRAALQQLSPPVMQSLLDNRWEDFLLLFRRKREALTLLDDLE